MSKETNEIKIEELKKEKEKILKEKRNLGWDIEKLETKLALLREKESLIDKRLSERGYRV